jgi:beta-N-acetylhexosaminidase
VTAKAFISGCAGTSLSPDETAFFSEHRPWGLILFKRNCADPSEIRDLAAAFRDAVGHRAAPVLIDQEGGRVQRIGPPKWPSYPPSRMLGAVAEGDEAAGERAAWLQGRLIGADLEELGITVDCAPVLDVIVPGASEAIGNRSFGSDPQLVSRLGRAMAEGLLDAGVLPVVKHSPGQGRATSDSHYDLPVVATDLATLSASDFRPFSDLADLPMAMTSHIVYAAVDPGGPATTSTAVIRDIIRKRISFDGLLMSDDISMQALSGDYASRAARITDAGCDIVLHCNGRIEEMRAVAEAVLPLSGKAGERAARALGMRRRPSAFDRVAGREELLALVERAGWPAVA